ncbi:hypothetical protein SAMN05660236_5686 [Ohtaekwangia koreensis]|uniref:Uncharacterized protein n=1 Tax=Ohtaekwangia koreensis TaxID=688867 RepID=A0A1T5MKM4_9BACT|nr:hypothetical protein SAMN05660236_5686 [Ohtaekwangia koreensis]
MSFNLVAKGKSVGFINNKRILNKALTLSHNYVLPHLKIPTAIPIYIL